MEVDVEAHEGIRPQMVLQTQPLVEAGALGHIGIVLDVLAQDGVAQLHQKSGAIHHLFVPSEQAEAEFVPEGRADIVYAAILGIDGGGHRFVVHQFGPTAEFRSPACLPVVTYS